MDAADSPTLTSCTSTINTFRLPPNVEGPLASPGDTKVVLVETPGFDDMRKADYEIFSMVTQWPRKASVSRIFLGRVMSLT